jgi:RimJ/RimL family protein N-acetyltransferase
MLQTIFMTAIELRRPVAADAERIEEIRMTAWQRAYRGMIAQDVLDAFPGDPGRRRDGILHPRPGTVDWVALDGDRIIGWIRGGASRDDDAGPDTREIYACYVAPSHWRGGVGTVLMRAALDGLSTPSSEVTLWVLSANRAARAFYESLGFRPDGACKPLDIDPSAEEMRYNRAAPSL